MSAKTIYYRGFLRSCNYKCGYCPFRKCGSHTDISEDRAALIKFADKIKDFPENINIMILPYGEALIHEYYHEGLAQIASYDNVKKIGCQTNGSFDVDMLVKHVEHLEKLSLWCSFHPTEISAADFNRQCERLMHHDISFSVGAVAHPKNSDSIRQLRETLPPNIYLWINAMEGMARPYTPKEISFFKEIDPLFDLDLETIPANPQLCTAAQNSLFIEGSGNAFACNISRVKIGNLYTGFTTEKETHTICRAKNCHCYTAYSNRIDNKNLSFFGENAPLRRPEYFSWHGNQKAYFFDIDGTLTNGNGEIPQGNIDTVQKLSQNSLVFVATSLPIRFAKEICKKIWPYLAGGVFAEGSHLEIFSQDYKKVFPLAKGVKNTVPQGLRHVCYHESGFLHKITITEKTAFAPENCNIYCEDGITGIVSKESSKLKGILHICRRLSLKENNIITVGNSDNDIEMLKYFENSVAVPGASENAKNHAGSVLSVAEIYSCST